MKKALLISYYWPPASGPGVQRWLRFSRYFKENGIELTIAIPEGAAYPLVDDNLIHQVPAGITLIRIPIFEVVRLGGSTGVALTSERKQTFTDKLKLWLRGNLLIPDARVFWIKPASHTLKKYIRQYPQDFVISTGPPHSTHLIALNLKKSFPETKWIADFRDPWTNIDFYRDLRLTSMADALHHKMERKVLQSADVVFTVGDVMSEEFRQMGAQNVYTLTNGYIFEDFDYKNLELDKEFSIGHFGNMPAPRNPQIVWKVLKKLSDESEDFRRNLRIHLTGHVDSSVLESIAEYDLEKSTVRFGQIPHGESILMQRKTQVLLLVANNTPNAKGILTGKVFEYMGANRPVLAIGPEGGDLQKVIEETECGVFADYLDGEKVEKLIRGWYAAYKEGNLYVEGGGREKYSSGGLVKRMVEVMNGM